MVRKERWPSGCERAVAGFPAFYTPAGDGTMIADGGLPWRYAADGSVAIASPKKETRVFRGREYVLEEGIVCDYALVRASTGDRAGNLIFDKATRNFNPLCAMAVESRSPKSRSWSTPARSTRRTCTFLVFSYSESCASVRKANA